MPSASVETSAKRTIALLDTNIHGRSQDSDITIRIPDLGVGRRQARIWHDNGVWFLEEMSLLYRVRINGKQIRVTDALARMTLNDRDLISLGSHQLWFRLDVSELKHHLDQIPPPGFWEKRPGIVTLAKAVSQMTKKEYYRQLGEGSQWLCA